MDNVHFESLAILSVKISPKIALRLADVRVFRIRDKCITNTSATIFTIAARIFIPFDAN